MLIIYYTINVSLFTFQPAGLLTFLHSDEATPTQDVDRLNVRDNLKMAISDAESNKGNALLRAAGITIH
jgi:hypothetical protein